MSNAPAKELGKILEALEAGYENPEPGAYLVRLTGTHKIGILTWLIAGEHSLHVEAFWTGPETSIWSDACPWPPLPRTRSTGSSAAS
jgi:hypothetical protein